LEFKGFQELNPDELMLVDGGNSDFWWALGGALAIAATPYVAVKAGFEAASWTFSSGLAMLSQIG